MKQLLTLWAIIVMADASAQNIVNYDIALVRGLWKCDSSASIRLPGMNESSDLGRVLQLYVNNREVYLVTGIRKEEENTYDIQTHHCDLIHAHATDLDSYLNEQNVSRDDTGLRPGMVIQVKINCWAYPFTEFVRLNDNTIMAVWNGQIQFFHKK